MVNLLEKLNYTRTTLIQGKDTEDREEGKRIFFRLSFMRKKFPCILMVSMLFYLKRNILGRI